MNSANEMIKEIKKAENPVNENVEIKYDLNKYDEILEGDDDNVVFERYATLYDKLHKTIVDKRLAIQKGGEAISKLNEIMNFLQKLTTNDINSIVNKEKDNANKLILKLNRLVDEMIKKKDEIYNKNENLINQKIKEEAAKRKLDYDSEKDDLLQMKFDCYKPSTQFPNDKEMQQLEESMSYLKEWSGKQNYSIIFDSNKDGDGSNGVLKNKVFNKQNLYFISFDDSNNVFGGYVAQQINKTGGFINDPNSFVFSLLRNGVEKNKHYLIQPGKENEAFYLSNAGSMLYVFGKSGKYNNIRIHKIKTTESLCDPCYYQYNGEQKPLVDKEYPNKFTTKRVVVLEME
ncbi:TLDc domain-containing protein [Entamoeba marina]